MASRGRTVVGFALWLVLASKLNGVSSISRDDAIIPETCGQDFTFTYPASHPTVTHDAYVMVTTYSSSPVSVTVSVPGIPFTNITTISSTNYANITFPRSVMFTRDDVMVYKAVRITADDDVCVFAICTSGSTADGFTVLPKGALGKRYIITSFEPLINYRHPSEFVVTALEEQTVVNINFNHEGHENLQKVLEPYQSFQFRDFSHDLTGTLITSDKPLSVMSGNECANVPNTVGKCEFLVTHMPGTDGFGRNFVLTPFLGRGAGYVFRVLAISNGTNITISDGTSVTLSQFNFFEGDTTDVNAITTITSDKDVIVTQYAKGLYSDYKTGDPFMLLVPPTNFFTNNVTFPVTTIPSTASQQAYINVLVLCEDNLEITVNGRVDDSWEDRLNDGGEFCVLRREMDPGLHSVGHPSRSALFAVVVYGFVWRASFAYFAGYNLHETDVSITNSGVTQGPGMLTMPSGPTLYPDTAGRHFAFAFPTPTSSMREAYVLVTTLTAVSTSVTVSIPGIQFQTTVPVSRSQHANVTLPYNSILRLTSTTGKSQKTVVINSQTMVSVWAVCGGSTTMDAFIILPIKTHGNQYVVAGYHPLISYGHASEFTVSSLDRKTVVNISAGHDSPEQYVLQPYETLLYRNVERDLTGTTIYSNNPVSVVSGCQCANVPATTGKCEYIVDHLPPVGSFGRQFVLGPFLGRLSGYVFRVMTGSEATLVRLSDGRSFLIQPYDYHEVDITNDQVTIVSSKNPVMVSQFAKGCYSDYLTGDPFMMLIPPTEYYSASVTFPVTTISTTEHQKAYINVVIDCQLSASLILDGQVLTDWNNITTPHGFCVLRRRVSPGVHTVWHPNQDARFSVVVYAFAWRAAYGYMAGFNILQRSVPSTASGQGAQTTPVLLTNTQRPKQDNSASVTSKYSIFTNPPKVPLKTPTSDLTAVVKSGDDDDRGNYAKNVADNSAGMRVRQNFMMFMCIITVLLMLIVLFAILLFWRDWRKLNHGSISTMSTCTQQDNIDDAKSTDGIAMEHIEPEPFTDYDKNPLI